MQKRILLVLLILGILSLGLLVSRWRIDPKGSLTICDVGQGSAALISQGHMQILIDTGPRYDLLAKCLDNHMSNRDRIIEAVILSHPDYDHYGGLLRIKERYRVQRLFVNESMYKSPKYMDQIKDIANRVSYLTKGDVLKYGLLKLTVELPLLDAGECVNGADKNDCSLVISVCNETFELGCGLIPGDYPMQNIQLLNPEIAGRLEWLVIPHHGSEHLWSISPLLKMNKLKTVYISVGKDNSYGHPNGKVLKDLESKGLSIFRTDLSGSLSVDDYK